MEAGKEGQVRSVSCEGPEICTRTKGRSEAIGPMPPPTQANKLERKTAEAAGPEVPRTRGPEAAASSDWALGLLGPSNHWPAARIPGPRLLAVNCLFIRSLLPIALITIAYATRLNIMQGNEQ